jgi:hypothetical protein
MPGLGFGLSPQNQMAHELTMGLGNAATDTGWVGGGRNDGGGATVVVIQLLRLEGGWGGCCWHHITSPKLSRATATCQSTLQASSK